MADPLDEVLQLVADGRLTAEEAAPIIDALEAGADAEALGEAALADAGLDDEPGPRAGSTGPARAIRLEVSEGGRKVVNLRVPLSLGRVALDRIPGLSSDNVSRIRQALDEGLTGPILVVDEDDGEGVRIVLE
jgi:SHOCT-like domain